MTEEHVIDLLPGYVLECLDDADLLTVARHLAHCDGCSQELATYRDTLDQLALSVPIFTPPTNLKQKVLNRIEQKQQQRTPPQPAAARPGFLNTLRSILFSPPGAVFAGVALLLIVILGINNIILGQRINDLQARLPADNIRLVKLNGTQNAPQTSGYLMVFKNELYGSLVVEDAPVTDSQHQYQLWLIRDGKRTNGGVFSVNGTGYGVLEVAADQPLENFQTFGITVEPLGGSPGPTGKKVMGGSL